LIITVSPAPLAGNVQLPANASALHRHLLCAALCSAHTLIEADCANLGTQALCDGLTRFGSRSAHDKQHYLIAPAKSHLQQGIRIDCARSITAMDLLLPLCNDVVFEHLPALNESAWQTRTSFLQEHGIHILRSGDTLHVRGSLKSGTYHFSRTFGIRLASSVMIALALCDGVSIISVDSDAHNMQSYLAMTAETMRRFGVEILSSATGYIVYGNQTYTSPRRCAVEADWDTAAMWLAAKHAGASIELENLPENSYQNSKRICALLPNVGRDVYLEGQLNLLPALCIAAAQCSEDTTIHGICTINNPCVDAVKSVLESMGIVCDVDESTMTIHGGKIRGAMVDCAGDSRLAMMTALCATFAQAPVTIQNAESVLKSDPSFYRRLQDLGADIQIEQ